MDQSEQQPNPTQPPQSQEGSTEARLTVIGLGASAGGLAALQAFLDALPAQTGMTFVVVVHLSPQHGSILAELLQPHTGMPVQQVTEAVTMQPDHVYVIPPGKRLLMRDDLLELADFDMPLGRRLQIDAFFRSLAEHHGDGGALIFSGTGSDGAVGIQSIKEGGGLILVQDPAEAEFDGMPKSAIATGLVDIVAPVAELAAKLVAAKQTRAGLALPANPNDLSAAAEQTLIQILAHLRVRTGHDFNGYKRNTLLRRIGRRMQISQAETLTAYLHRLRQDGEEVDALFRDILIHVTEFFRDAEAWQALAHDIVPSLFAPDGRPKGSDDTVRVWTVGCATGEEAYSIGMLLLEHAATLAHTPRIQVFASDLGTLTLDYARNGVYPEAIAAHVSPERLARFFTQENSHYRVKEELREIVIFTPHNLLQDPPFSRLDLVLCRNLLIYLQREMQDRVYATFHYALRPDGYLFLGSAETAEGVSDLFEMINKSYRLYRRRTLHDTRGQPLKILPRLEGNHPSHLSARATSSPASPQGKPSALPNRASAGAGATAHRLLLEEIAPPSLLIDEKYNVIHISETAGRYLHHPGGMLTSDVMRLVRPELQDELRAALASALVSGRMARSRPAPVRFNGASRPVSLVVHPSAHSGHTLIFFLEENSADVSDGQSEQAPSAEGRSRVEAELRLIQQQMQALQEEYETTVEELQSTNEEYRAATEELETSKEELQSINEELHTVNQELRTRVEQTTQAHGDLQNLFAATEIATLFLDRNLCIQRYTPAAADLFNLMPPDQGRPITHLRSNLAYPELEDDARRVLRALVPVVRDVQNEDGRWLHVGVRPYRTVEDRIDGVVITFVDITQNKEIESALRDAKEYAESIIHTIPDALLVLETNLCVRTANDTFYQMFQVDPKATEGELIYNLGNGQWDIPELRTLLEEILPDNKVFIGYEVDHVFEDIGRRTMLLNGRRLDHVQLILLVIADITERKRAEESIRTAQASLDLALSAAHMGTWDLDLATDQSRTDLRHNRLFGYTEAVGEWNPSRYLEHVLAEDRPKFEAAHAQALETGELDVEVRVRWPDGSIHWVQDRGRVYHNEAGDPVRIVGVSVDVTEHKEAQQAEMRQRIIRGQEAERTHLAREIHDGPVQHLTALTFRLATLAQAVAEETLRAELLAIGDEIGTMIGSLRNVMVTLRPPAVAQFGLRSALKNHVAELQQAEADALPAQPPIFRLDLDESIPDLPDEITLALYRIAQQSLYNILRHAHAQTAWVRLHRQGDGPQTSLVLEVEDDGRGFEVPAEWTELAGRRHLGIVGMNERAAAIGGTLEINSTPGEGTLVRVRVPLPQP